jgi:hypothetical protein
LEEKDKEEKDTKEVVSEKVTQEEAKHVSLSKEDEDKTTLIKKLIKKLEIVVDPIDKGKTKEQKVGKRIKLLAWMESG